MSLDTVTPSLKESGIRPPAPCCPSPPQAAGREGSEREDKGPSLQPPPSSGSGENPCLFTAPPPPSEWSLICLRIEFKIEIKKKEEKKLGAKRS